jgi:hypothetical protein
MIVFKRKSNAHIAAKLDLSKAFFKKLIKWQRTYLTSSRDPTATASS